MFLPSPTLEISLACAKNFHINIIFFTLLHACVSGCSWRVQALVGYLDDVQYMPHLCACEWHSGAMRELRAHPSKPQCLYKDIAGFLKPEYAHYDGKRLLEALLDRRMATAYR